LGVPERSSSKKKCQMGYKSSREQLRAPTRKKTSLLSSSHLSSSEYEESSDDNEKGPTVDKRHKGPQKAMNKRDSNDDINDVQTTMDKKNR
jgi:hypothetical protein